MKRGMIINFYYAVSYLDEFNIGCSRFDSTVANFLTPIVLDLLHAQQTHLSIKENSVK